MKNRCHIPLLHALLRLALIFITAGSAAAAPELLSQKMEEFGYSLTHSGDPGGLYALEVSPDLAAWTAVSRCTETTPGLFAAATSPALPPARQFLRINGSLGPVLIGWMETYPVYPDTGDDIPSDAPLRWTPLGAPGLTYDSELFEARSDGAGGYFPAPLPILKQTGLTVPAWDPSPSTSAIHTGGTYIWRVTARIGSRAIQGRDVPVFGPGKTTGRFNFPSSGLRNPPAANPTDWARLLRAINEIAARKAVLEQELAGNPLAQDSALYAQLMTLLSINETTQTALLAILAGDFSALSDPEVVLQALKYLQALAEFASRPDAGKPQTAAQRSLAAFAAKIGTIRTGLQNAADRAAQLQNTLNALGAAVAEARAAIDDPIGYLLEMAKEKLLEKLQAKLAALVGKKAAGALIGIAGDLIALGQLISAITELEALCREQNRLILQAIACAPPSQVAGGSGTVDLPPNSAGYPPGCSVTLTAKKYCWGATPGGGPDDGHFTSSPVRFAGGAPAVTFPIPAGTVNFRTPTIVFLPSDINCQPNQGPCLLFIEAVISCPGRGPGRTMTFFAGVIRCP